MKINITNLMFMFIMINSIIMMISSNNLLISWTMMEINLISFLPLIAQSKKISDQLMKYLIIQSSSSSIMLMSMLMNSFMETEINSSLLMTLSMIMKMGLMPTHLWMPSLMVKMSWNNCLILSTIQKIIPMILTTQLIKMNLIFLPSTISLLLSPVMGMKQLSTKKIMAYSSISNMPWMLMSMYFSMQIFLMFMTIYSLMNMMIMKMLNKQNINYMNQIKPMKKMTKLNFIVMMLSISGMPPTIGFMIKWIILSTLMSNNMIIMSSIMIISSTMMTYTYMKMCYSSMMMLSTNKKKKMMKPTMNFLITNFFLILILMILPK